MEGKKWYNEIARRNGGYKSDAEYTLEGRSGEKVFKKKLIKMLPQYKTVLDAGCGHGEFTLEMSQYTDKIIGIDFSTELLKIAKRLRKENNIKNVEFILASTKEELPFPDEKFDLIYDRRGPTSILNHGRILKSGGIIFGIHSAALEKVKHRLKKNDFENIKVKVFDDAIKYFPDKDEFAKYLSASHLNPDYTKPENKDELEKKIEENKINGRIALKEWRYIWKAEKPK